MTTRKFLTKRRFFLYLASLSLAYPLLSFLGFKAPRKPKIFRLKLDLKPGEYHTEPDFVLFIDNKKQAWAVSRKCTHLGCTIQFHEQQRIFICPCHQSRFTDRGTVINGPAKRNLPQYKVEKLDEQNIFVVTI